MTALAIPWERAADARVTATLWALVLALALGPLLLAPTAHAEDGEGPQISDHQVRVAEGASATVDLLDGSDGAQAGTARLRIDGLPGGTVVTEDGRSVTVPGEGSWSVVGDVATFTPTGPRLDTQPSPIQYEALDGSGIRSTPATITVSVPLVPDLTRASAYGDPATFDVIEGAQHIERESLHLVPIDGLDTAEISEDGLRAQVPEQGQWELDPATGSAVFTPVSEQVQQVTPIGVRGADENGVRSGTALLSVGYPMLAAQYAAGAEGEILYIDPMNASRNIRADSLRFGGEGLPDGAELAEDGLSVLVADEGTWELDAETRIVSFTPFAGLEGSPQPVPITGTGLYSTATTSTSLYAQYADQVPTLQDDEARGPVGTPIYLDALANDQPARASRPLEPSTLQIRSPLASNTTELVDGAGTRLVIPGEGEYTAAPTGVISFRPLPGFRGAATPIEYDVQDSSGMIVGATAYFVVDPLMTTTGASGSEVSGINTLLAGLMPGSTSTFVVYLTLVSMLLFAGMLALWIGARMESDRRTWGDGRPDRDAKRRSAR